MSTLDERVGNLENRMSTVEATLDRIATAQEQNQIQLNTLTQRLDAFAQDNRSLAQRLDSFIYESQRIARNTSERANRNEAAVEVLHNATGNLMRSVSELRDSVFETGNSVSMLQNEARADRAEFNRFIERTDSMISRLDALVNYLMRNG